MTLFGTSILIAAIENFVLLGTFFALGTFAVALIVRQLTIRQLWRPRAESVSHFYAATLVLFSHYSHLMTEEGVGFRDAIVQGSMERLSPILMTALVTGVGLIPLALGVGEPGKEIQQPMAVVILGGIFTSTFLNMIVIPALYLKYGREEAPSPARDYSHVRGLAPAGD